jgi:hypothetical protein
VAAHDLQHLGQPSALLGEPRLQAGDALFERVKASVLLHAVPRFTPSFFGAVGRPDAAVVVASTFAAHPLRRNPNPPHFLHST